MIKVVTSFFVLSALYVSGVLYYFGYGVKIDQKWKTTFHYEKRALELAHENRLLKVKINDLEYQVNQATNQNKVLAAQVEKPRKVDRSIASIPKVNPNDLVNYDVYQWSPEKLLAIGEKELHFKNYQKSAQFYHELISRFPEHEIVNDSVLFGAGIAAFETKENYKWVVEHLGQLVEKYPKSKFYRGAKLWIALSQYNLGDQQKFLATVEEFKTKYRNTEEWKILSKYYEDINYKIKK